MTVVLAAGSVLDPIYNVIGAVLAFFYSLVPNLGVAIILLTFAIMLLLYPLTAKQAKSMMAMQRVQPEIKKLQAKYKNDRQKLNEEMMKFYQENKINPLAGCLPLVVQLPIFFSLFRVLRDSYKHVPRTGSFAGLFNKLCGAVPHGTSVSKWVAHCGTKGVHHLTFLSIDLQKTATDPHGGIFSALPYFVLVGLVMATGFLQTRQAQSRTPVANKQMATVMKVLPVFFGLISLSFPAGLVLYFFVSNLWRLGQQEVIFRRHGHELTAGRAKGAIDVKSAERPAKALEATVDGEEDDADEDVVEEAPPPARRPKPQARPQPPPARPARVPAPARPGGGGLRSLFQLPPPPEGNGGGATPPVSRPTPPRSSAGGGAGGGSGGGGSQARRRRSNKKKRKR